MRTFERGLIGCLVAFLLVACGESDERKATPRVVVDAPPPAAEPTAEPVPAEPLALVGATVFDGTGKAAIPDAVVLVESGRIKALGPRAKTTIPKGTKTLDVSGRWIVPGLIDTHIHFFQSGGLYTRPDVIDLRHVRSYEVEQKAIRDDLEATWRRTLTAGVTAVVDVGGPMWNFDVREQARKSALAPRVAVAGPLIASVSRPQLDLGDPPIIEAKSVEHARELAREQLARSPDLVKIWFIVTPNRPMEKTLPVVRAVIDEARRAKVRVAVHATELETARAAVTAGADVLVHSVHDGPVDAALLAEMKRRGVLYNPNLVVMEGYAKVLGQRVTLTDIERRIGDPAVISSWGELAATQPATANDMLAERVKRMSAREPIMAANLRAARDAGVTIVAGTDAGNIGTLHGASLHRELELMAAAGMSPRAVLLAATRDAARVFAAEPEIGTLEPGKLADLLVLDADPLADVKNLRRIHRVVLGGVPHAPDELVPPNPEWVVQQQLDAYNARDLERFLAVYALDVKVARMPSGELIAKSRDEMRPRYRKLFDTSPKLHCNLLSRTVRGATVVDHELVTGHARGPYLHAIAVYRVERGLITHVWFHGP